MTEALSTTLARGVLDNQVFCIGFPLFLCTLPASGVPGLFFSPLL